jgi:thymidylate synthase (FAD)
MDVLENKVTEIKCLDHGYVQLCDCYPRLVPAGRDCEVAIVQAARVSYQQGLKDPVTDEKLVKYLIRNNHTSPLEAVQFTFRIYCPLFVAVHLLRHRTAKLNMQSQRYSQIREDVCYSALNTPGGIRSPDAVNKQGSAPISVVSAEMEALLKEAEATQQHLFELYSKLITVGLAKEVARGFLTTNQYTQMIFTMDLNNLRRFCALRCDSHAQWETQVYANAIKSLVQPLVPNCI